MNSRLGTIKINTIIVLIGIGWSFLNPYLQEREKNVLMLMIPLQVLANIMSIVIIENGPSTKYWLTWDQEFSNRYYLLHCHHFSISLVDQESM